MPKKTAIPSCSEIEKSEILGLYYIDILNMEAIK
jgi:hypothetical protein